jgi:hypothetical protein
MHVKHPALVLYIANPQSLPVTSPCHLLQGARQSFVPLIRRTNLLNAFYRALGVKIGRNVVIDTDDLLGYDCISLQDDCILDAACGVSAITYAAGKPGDKYPLGTMTVRAVTVGQRGVVGPNAVVTPGHVKPDAVVLPCSATSNPLSVWSGSTRPTHGPEASAAVKTQDPAFGVLAGLAALWITHLLILALGYPLTGVRCCLQWLTLYGAMSMSNRQWHDACRARPPLPPVHPAQHACHVSSGRSSPLRSDHRPVH